MTTGIVLPQTLAITEGKSSFSAVKGTLKRGEVVAIVEDSGDNWLKVRHEPTNLEGYAPASHVAISSVPLESIPQETKVYDVVVNANGSRLRSGPGVQHPILTVLKQGETLRVFGEEGEWLQVSFNNQKAYISAHLTQRKDTARDSSSFLGEQPDLLSIELRPRSIIPLAGLAPQSRAVVAAQVWNDYGGLLEVLAKKLQVPLSSIVAVIAAESGGKAFADDNRLIIRFEVHIFRRFWGDANRALFDRHFRADGFRNHQFRASEADGWAAVHTSQKREWEVLSFARTLDDTAALKSISMGAPQIMGFNYKALGYETVQEMFDTFSRSAHAQLLGLFDFVRGGSSISQAIRALQTGDFLTFASLYNGPGNAAVYEEIIEDYVTQFKQIIGTAVPVPLPDTQRGPMNLPATDAPRDKEILAAHNPPAAKIPDVVQPEAASAPPAEADVVLMPTTSINVRAEPSTASRSLGTVQKGASLRLLEPLQSALDKVRLPESARQFVQIEFNNQPAYVAAWLLAPARIMTQATINAYINRLPQAELPAGYHALWQQQERLGLPDPFDMLPVLPNSEAELVNMQVNGFGPNTFSMWNGAKWYSRIGYMHNGYDFISKSGTPLIAVADGVIIRNWLFMANKAEKTVVLWCFLPERYRDSQGRRMLSNVLVAMGHLANNTVRRNHEVVRRGDIIGYTGTPAGSQTNDHLHYEVHLINGDPTLPNARKIRLLKEYKGEQNASNNTPWNALLFYTPRLINYQIHQGKTIGFLGKYPEYPTRDMLRQNGSLHLDPLDPFALAYYRYGIPNVWKPQRSGARWPEGVVETASLPERLASLPAWNPAPLDFV
jgi:murein DD-endopeptidase MepM/ murein hydrolase activator NlpD/uncharacterized protein YgiM (DUF1202 family)